MSVKIKVYQPGSAGHGRGRAWLALAALAVLGTAFAHDAPPPFEKAPAGPGRLADRAALKAGLRRDLSPAAVRDLLGPPARVARQVLYHRHLEQWVYGPPFEYRLEFDCVRGQKPRLRDWSPLTPDAP